MTPASSSIVHDLRHDATTPGIDASSPVLTPSGWIEAGDLHVGDDLITADGTTTVVRELRGHRCEKPYRVKFTDGSSLTATPGQPITLLRRYGNRRAWTPMESTIGELAQADLRLGSERRYRVPLIAPVALPDRELPIDPYILGAFLANGHAGSSVQISSPDPEVLERLVAAGGRMVANGTGACPRVLMHGAISTIRDLGVDVHSANKFIPPDYLVAGLQQRIDLLHSLMDGDGTGSAKGRSTVRYSTTSRRLADDLVVLLNTLGGTGKIQVQDRTHHGKPVEYTVNVMLPAAINPFFTSAKERGITKNATGPGRAVVSVDLVKPCSVVAVSTDGNGSGIVVSPRCLVVPAGRRSSTGSEAVAPLAA